MGLFLAVGTVFMTKTRRDIVNNLMGFAASVNRPIKRGIEPQPMFAGSNHAQVARNRAVQKQQESLQRGQLYPGQSRSERLRSVQLRPAQCYPGRRDLRELHSSQPYLRNFRKEYLGRQGQQHQVHDAQPHPSQFFSAQHPEQHFSG